MSTTKVPSQLNQRVVTLVSSAAITIDCSLGDTFDVILAHNTTFTFTNPSDGQKVILRIEQDGTGSRSGAYAAGVGFGSDVTSPTLSTTAGKIDVLGFQYKSSKSKMYLLSVAKGY